MAGKGGSNELEWTISRSAPDNYVYVMYVRGQVSLQEQFPLVSAFGLSPSYDEADVY